MRGEEEERGRGEGERRGGEERGRGEGERRGGEERGRGEGERRGRGIPSEAGALKELLTESICPFTTEISWFEIPTRKERKEKEKVRHWRKKKKEEKRELDKEQREHTSSQIKYGVVCNGH